ncbi:MAG TPA: hypothetical protein PLF75_12825, partial [Bacteroidales bacterium]|nr:hypothetical protein [Bacteroidales bacterium]
LSFLEQTVREHYPLKQGLRLCLAQCLKILSKGLFKPQKAFSIKSKNCVYWRFIPFPLQGSGVGGESATTTLLIVDRYYCPHTCFLHYNIRQAYCNFKNLLYIEPKLNNPIKLC